MTPRLSLAPARTPGKEQNAHGLPQVAHPTRDQFLGIACVLIGWAVATLIVLLCSVR